LKIRETFFIKTKRLCNPAEGNSWNRRKLGINQIVSENGLDADPSANYWIRVLYAQHGFPISIENTRADNFRGTIIYYFEVKQFGHLS
jgi:hypothetical protein